MKFEDLVAHINNFRGNKTQRNINVYVNNETYDKLTDKSINYIISFNYNLISAYYKDGNFTLNNNELINYKIEDNYCIINSDIGECYSEILTENERIIKGLLE